MRINIDFFKKLSLKVIFYEIFQFSINYIKVLPQNYYIIEKVDLFPPNSYVSN